METSNLRNKKLLNDNICKAETQSSTRHTHKGLYGERNRVHEQQLTSQTSQDHISLQNYTAQAHQMKKEVDSLVLINKYQIQIEDTRQDHTARIAGRNIILHLSSHWFMPIPENISFNHIRSTFLALCNQVRPHLKSYQMQNKTLSHPIMVKRD